MDARQPVPEGFEEQIYCAAVVPGDTCFDVGANVGQMSLLFAELAGPEGLVVAFEPVWPMYRELCAGVQRGSTATAAPIVTVPMGLADEEATATIQVRGDDFGMGSLARSDVWATILDRHEITSYACTLTTLDRVRATAQLPAPDVMKIDVEGAELLVLRGATGLFDSGARPLLLVELFAPWERAFGYEPWAVLSLLAERGYRFLFACPEGLVDHEPTAEDPFPAEFVGGYNVLAYQPNAHRDRLDALSRLRAGTGATILPMPAAPLPNR